MNVYNILLPNFDPMYDPWYSVHTLRKLDLTNFLLMILPSLAIYMSQNLCCVAAIFTPMPLNVIGIAAKSFE